MHCGALYMKKSPRFIIDMSIRKLGSYDLTSGCKSTLGAYVPLERPLWSIPEYFQKYGFVWVL